LILFIEPVSKNIGMYVPAYPLPILEIASFVKTNRPDIEIEIISIPIDYGLPLNKDGKEQIYQKLLQDIAQMRPKGIGISCTAISQAEEVIEVCDFIKAYDPGMFIFLGGYFPTIYYEEIFSRTSAVDLIVIGEGEEPALRIIGHLERDENPLSQEIPNLAWKEDGQIRFSSKRMGFDLNKKALLNMELLRHPRSYDILPYAFSRGCPYRCNFCMEEFIRPQRKEVPSRIIHQDLINLSQRSDTPTLLVGDALFKSFNIFPFLHAQGMKANFETRCDVLSPSLLAQISDVCGMLALGFESASFDTLRRMNKVRNRDHYEKYISNTIAIFKEAVNNEIPIIIFMIAGYPGDTENDLEVTLRFIKSLSQNSGSGGHVFKIGECHVYPRTKIYDLATSLPDVVFDNDGVFGQNTVRKPSKDLKFDKVLYYMKEIYDLSNYTPKFQKNFRDMMPFFRLPAQALRDEMIPEQCFMGSERNVFNVQGKSLSALRARIPELTGKYQNLMSGERRTRSLPI
jgi:radical SAM superfamily enzyme YgiQ (UPF0313 family)